MRQRFAGAETGRRGFGTAKDGWLAPGVRGDFALQPGNEAKVLAVGFQGLSRWINVPAHRVLPEELGGKSGARARSAW